MGPLLVNSTVENSDIQIKFKIQVYQRADSGPFMYLNPKMADVTLKLGCFEDKLSHFWDLTTNHSVGTNFANFQKSTLTFIYAKPKKTQQKSVYLNQIFAFTPDFKGCGAYKIQAFQDA